MGPGREVRKFSKQEYWSEWPSPFPGAFAQPTDPTRFCTAGRFFTQPPGKPKEEAISQEVWNGMGGWGGRGTCWEGGRGPRPSQECDRGNFRIFNESFWLCWVFVAAEADSGCGERRCSARTAHCAGFSCGARAPGTRGLRAHVGSSRCGVRAQQSRPPGSGAQARWSGRRLSGCSAAGGIFPDQGQDEPASPALAGGFLTTEPPGKLL